MPTKPETQIVSPSRMIAIASSAETILFVSAMRDPFSLALGEPFGDAGTQQPLGLAADEHADVPAGKRQFGVVRAADLPAQCPRGGRRYDVIVAGEDVEHGHVDVAQIDAPSSELELVTYQLVVLIEVDQPLLGRLSGVVRPVRDPLFHAQEVQEFLLV